MQTLLRTTTTVLPGNRVEITSPQLREGDRVQVVVELEVDPIAGRKSALDIINEYHGTGAARRTAQQIDAELQEERDSWDR